MLPEGYEIRALAEADAPALAAAYRRNREHLAPWDPRREDAFFTEERQAAEVARSLDAVGAGSLDAWLLTCGDDVVGRVSLSNMARGVFQSANLGYWTDHAHVGRGLATAAVQHALLRAEELGLHRVEAGTLPHNAGSQRVLLRCGFEQVGLAPHYLFIAGAWQDHLIFQRILHDRPASGARLGEGR